MMTILAALKQISQHTNVKLRDVASLVVAGSRGAPGPVDEKTGDVVLAEVRWLVLDRDPG
jgi:hypothetical protein